MRLIDADELKEGLRGNFKDVMGNFVFNTTFAELEAIIDTAPTVKVLSKRPQGEWIPVGERLPEGKIEPMTNDFELVLCSTVWGIVRPYKFGKPIGHDKAHFWSGAGVMDDYVIAWMPLPEAYKEAENE